MIEMQIDKMLQEKGRSLYWLSKQAGVGYSTLWKLKTGRAQGISYRVLENICTALDCQPGDLLVMTAAKRKARRK